MFCARGKRSRKVAICIDTGWACILCLHQPLSVKCHLWQKLDFVSVLVRLQHGLPMLMLHWESDSSIEACLSMAWGGLPTECGTDPALPTPSVLWLQIGFSIGASFLGGLLLLKVHWRWLWYISSAMALLMAAMLMIMLPAEHPYPLNNQGRCALAGRQLPPESSQA